MKDDQVLEKLEEAARRLSIQLGYEDLRKGEVNTHGGLFLLKGEKHILIHKGLSTKDKIDVLSRALSTLDTEGIHLPEAIRKRLEGLKEG
ncbi:MAG: hypothetical protein ACE5EB_09280 [Thermodesulfobacteriota bacterium]